MEQFTVVWQDEDGERYSRSLDARSGEHAISLAAVPGNATGVAVASVADIVSEEGVEFSEDLSGKTVLRAGKRQDRVEIIERDVPDDQTTATPPNTPERADVDVRLGRVAPESDVPEFGRGAGERPLA